MRSFKETIYFRGIALVFFASMLAQFLSSCSQIDANGNLPPHPTPGAVDYSIPSDCVDILGDTDTRDFELPGGRVYIGTSGFPAKMCLSPQNFELYRQLLVQDGMDPNHLVYVNMLGFQACSGYMEVAQQDGKQPLRVSPHVLAAHWVYRYGGFDKKDLNDAETRKLFYQAISTQFLNWLEHEGTHIVQMDQGRLGDPINRLETEAIQREYDLSIQNPVFVVYGDLSPEELEDVRYTEFAPMSRGTIDYNLLWAKWANVMDQYCEAP